mgnify:CR=1 FL=1
MSKTKKVIKRTKDRTELKIVKRAGHTELYDERKVYGSCFFACRNAHLSKEEAEDICSKVCKAISKWANKRRVISSDDIFRILINELKKHNEDAAFLYETHRDIS